MKDSDSISKKSSSDSENLVNNKVPEMPKDKRTKAYKEWVKKYGDLTSESNAIPEMPKDKSCLLYTSPSPRDRTRSRMPSSA